MLDKSKPGANIRVIHDIVKEHLRDMEPGDLVVIEGGGNDLEETGGRETGWKNKQTDENKEEAIGDVHPHEVGQEVTTWPREEVGKQGCIGMLEECGVRWITSVGKDGLDVGVVTRWGPLSNTDTIWVAWNLVEWGQHWVDARQG